MYRVIIADDEPLILAGLSHKVDWHSLGFTIVRECTDGLSLLDAIQEEHPDLIVTDIQMPNITGLDCLKMIEGLSSTRSILISGYSEFAYAQEAIRLGAIDYLLKPVSPTLLRDSLLKAKHELDRARISDTLHYLQQTTNVLSSKEWFARLGISGTKKGYWLAAFDSEIVSEVPSESESILLPFGEKTNLFLLHTNLPPECCIDTICSICHYDTDIGIVTPFDDIQFLPIAAESAVQLLEMRYLTHGVHLWSTGNEKRSIKHFIDQVHDAVQNTTRSTLGTVLNTLPAYAQEHRLNMKSIEIIFNSLIPGQSNEPVHYLTSRELVRQYPTFDQLHTALYSALLPQSNESATSASKEIIFKIKAILQKDYALPILLQDMASRFHIDKSYLSSMFHEEVGETFTNYLTNIRLQHACEYLRTSDITHNEIAQLCGFSTDSYMKKVFRKVLGITPSVYRNTHSVNKTP